MELLHREERSTDGAFAQISVPASHTHLVLMHTGRSATVASTDRIRLRFNGDTGTNYHTGWILDLESVFFHATADGFSQTSLLVGSTPAASAPAGLAAYRRVHIPFYRDTAFHHSTYTDGVQDYDNSAGSFEGHIAWGTWASTAAITTIDLFDESGNGYETGSIVELWGL